MDTKISAGNEIAAAFYNDDNASVDSKWQYGSFWSIVNCPDSKDNYKVV